MAKRDDLTADDLWVMLRKRFEPPAWGVLAEVRNGTGYSRAARYADAVAMSLWPSRGLELHGIEIKVSRSDWLRERDNPAKSEEIWRFCDRWWLAVADRSIVKPGELPPTWGLLTPRGGKLVADVEAPKLDAQPITRLFLAALFRSLVEQSASEAAIKAAVISAVEGERKRQADNRETDRKAARLEADELTRRIREFEAASGLAIDRWSAGRMGEVVKLLMERGGPARVKEELEALHQRAGEMTARLGQCLAEWPKTGALDAEQGRG